MAKIGLYQVDGTKYQGIPFPNLALMQISSYHKNKGDTVEWYKGLMFAHEYEKIYASKIFSFSPMPEIPENMIIGGTGIDFTNVLPAEIEQQPIDWEIYPNTPFHYGFSMKGCRYKCTFCCVPKKEGNPRAYNTIDRILTNPSGGKNLMLLDNDFFGNSEKKNSENNWRVNIERIIELDLKVCFVQGLNIRNITSEQATYLTKCNYRNSKFNKKYVTFAWDRWIDGKAIRNGIERVINAGIPGENMQFFILIGYDTTPEQDLERVETLKSMGCKPFVMPYNRENRYQKDFARWVNNRIVFNSCSWQEYNKMPKKVNVNQMVLEL
ncbi:MAG: hypothetical protein MUC49_02185 [Raineya sp.]|jgi:hypothetical protein|nr:hypothetical protein [Raineya sp.]